MARVLALLLLLAAPNALAGAGEAYSAPQRGPGRLSVKRSFTKKLIAGLISASIALGAPAGVGATQGPDTRGRQEPSALTTTLAPSAVQPETHLSTQANPKRLAAVERYKREFASFKIPAAQREGWATPYAFTLSDRLFNSIAPFNYDRATEQLFAALKAGASGERPLFVHPRNDLWRLYLGMPAQDGMLEISKDLPAELANNPQALVYQLANVDHAKELLLNVAYRLDVAQKLRKARGIAEWPGTSLQPGKGGATSQFLITDSFFSSPKAVRDKLTAEQRNDPNSMAHFGSLGTMTVRLGQDAVGPYVEYVDFWDLDLPAPNSPFLVKIGLRLAKVLAGDSGGVSRLLNTIDRVGFPSSGTISIESYYGKPLWINERIHYTPQELKQLVELENRLSGHAAEDYLLSTDRDPSSVANHVRSMRQKVRRVATPADLAHLRALDPGYE